MVRPEDGEVHCFAQFGSGSLVAGTYTYLSRFDPRPACSLLPVQLPAQQWHLFLSLFSALPFRFILIDPVSLLREHEHLRAMGYRDVIVRLRIDRRCVVRAHACVWSGGGGEGGWLVAGLI